MKKYFLNYYVGGFVDTYITEEIELDDTKKVFVDFVGKTYSHIKGQAINVNVFDSKNREYVKQIIYRHRLAYIEELKKWKEEE